MSSSRRNLLRATDLVHTVERRVNGGDGHGLGEIGGGHRLEIHRGEPDGVTVGRLIGDPFTNSKNCVACTIEYGTPDFAISFSWASFALK